MLSNLKIKLFKSIKSKKLNVFGFFFLLAFLFLVFSKLSKTYTETIVFHINYKNVPEQHSITVYSDSIIFVKVKAYGFNLISHNFYRHTVSVNFDKDVQKFGKKYIWNTKNGINKVDSQLGSKIEVLSIAPDSLIFPFENMSVKTVPVKLNTEITFASGYDILDNINIEPDSVKVIGPKNIVDNISRINTKVLKLNNVNSTIDEKVNLVLDKSLQKVKISNDKVRLFGSVEKFTEGTFEVPITIINLPADVKINYFPKTISVSYYVSLQNYKSIKTSDFKIICDYSEVQNQDRTYFKPQLVTKSALVKSAKMKQNKVEFIITQ